MRGYTKEQSAVLGQKFGQLLAVKVNRLTQEELADRITQRRVNWMKEHLEEMLEKYKNLPAVEQAYRIIFLEHLGIDPEHSKMSNVSKNKIRIDSYNFCPYLEACRKVELNTKDVCKNILEPAMNEMIKMINPNLIFYRNYDKIRPDNKFCEEYIELKT